MKRLDRALIVTIIGLVGPLRLARAQSPTILFHSVRLFDGQRIVPSKGDGETYRLMLFAASRGQVPLDADIRRGAEWAEHVFPLASFAGIDGHDLMAVIFTAGPPLGGFELSIDPVSFR